MAWPVLTLYAGADVRAVGPVANPMFTTDSVGKWFSEWYVFVELLKVTKCEILLEIYIYMVGVGNWCGMQYFWKPAMCTAVNCTL